VEVVVKAGGTAGGKVLTNQAFWQSRVWREATESICGEGESPDELGAWEQARRLWKARRGARAVVTMGPRASLAYGVMCGAAGAESRQVLCEVFLSEGRGWKERGKDALYRWVAGRALGVLVNSRAEVATTARRWGLEERRVKFVPICTTSETEFREGTGEERVFCGGRTMRDWDTLWRAAGSIRGRVEAVAGADDLLPDGAGVDVAREIPLEEFRRRLAAADVVALPLKETTRSTGQVVLLEAMSMGKAVVTTRLPGTVDYVRDGETGILTEAGDAEGLAAAVNGLLADRERARQMGMAALEECRGRFSPDAHAKARLEAIGELAARVEKKGR
jgi:glycosyltransferase involved in cell wall biosynthesis